MPEQKFQRATAYKLRIGELNSGEENKKEGDKLDYLKVGNKEVRRVNLIANVIERFDNPGENKYVFFTLDDASGQIKIKAFGEDVEQFSDISQGDTVMVIGKLREYQGDIYVQPEIIKKKDPRYLLVRKLEIGKEEPEEKRDGDTKKVKDKIINMIREAEDQGGIETDKIVMELDSSPEAIKKEIQKLLEEGLAYEPKPGKVRYLG